jgi:glycosyltransferase 2 family protein
MKRASLAAAAVGSALIAALVVHFGADAVIRSLLAIGWQGFGAILLIHLALIAVMGIAWRTLLPGTRPLAAIWGRLVRDSASEVLPLTQVGGYVAGARAIAGADVSGIAATTTTIVDVTLECLAQLAYTGLALLLLLCLAPENRVASAVAAGLAVAVLIAIGFLAAQRRGFGLVDRVARAIGRDWAGRDWAGRDWAERDLAGRDWSGSDWADRTAAGAAALHTAIGDAYRRRGRLAAGFALHLFCWIASASEAWLALGLAGAPLGFGPVLTIEGLFYAVRSVAFAIPNAAGVQEGAYILLGAGFGLTPDIALALSLLKRARDLVIGLPVLGIWQLAETGRFWRLHQIAPVARLTNRSAIERFDRTAIATAPADALSAGLAAPPPPR